MFWSEPMARDLQILADYCGKQDVPALNQENIQRFFSSSKKDGKSAFDQKPADHDGKSMDQADILVLFGGSIINGMECLIEGLENSIAKTSIIVGGYGHTTAALQKNMEKLSGGIYPTEAETFQAALSKRGYSADLLETKSTNCGSNITYLLDLLEEKNIPVSTAIFIQDASMQKRMEATLHKYRPDIQVLNYPSSKTTFYAENGILKLKDAPEGMWDPTKFASLLMGELQRLQDNEQGYGPKGKAFITHLDIPQEVLDAYNRLLVKVPELVRSANPAFAS